MFLATFNNNKVGIEVQDTVKLAYCFRMCLL